MLNEEQRIAAAFAKLRQEIGFSQKSPYDLGEGTFINLSDVMDGPALTRMRQHVRENDGHDMAKINYNSLRRLITLIDKLGNHYA